MFTLGFLLRNRDVSPPALSPNAHLNTVVRRTLRYFRNNDWEVLPDAPWANVWIRAAQDGVTANLMIHQPDMGWRTLMLDAAEATLPLASPVGIMSLATIPLEVLQTFGQTGVYVLNPSTLPSIKDLIKETDRRRSEAREKALKAIV